STRTKEQVNARQHWELRKAELGLTRDMNLREQLTVVSAARRQKREQQPTREVIRGAVGVEQDARMLGDRAAEVVRDVQQEARDIWEVFQNTVAARELQRIGRAVVQDMRTRVEGVWADLHEAETLRMVGTEVLEDAWRAAALLWAEETGARALYDLGWDEVQAAREQGGVGVTGAVQAYEAAHQASYARQQTPAWEGMVDDLQALRQRLESMGGDGGAGSGVRVRLRDKEHERGMGL